MRKEEQKVLDYLNKYDFKTGTPVLMEYEIKNIMAYMNRTQQEIERLQSIIKEVRETLINSKEYKMAKEMNLTSKMSVLIELLEILDKVGDIK